MWILFGIILAIVFIALGLKWLENCLCKDGKLWEAFASVMSFLFAGLTCGIILALIF